MTAFLAETGFHWHDQVSGVLRAGFKRSLGQHVERLAADGRAARYIANRRHALNTWHRFMRRVDHDSAVCAGVETPLHSPHGSVAAVVRATGMRRQTLDNWRNRGGESAHPSRAATNA